MEAKKKPFITVQNHKDQDVLWIPKIRTNNILNCVAAFDAMSYLSFIDAINTLSYVEVINVTSISKDMSSITIRLIEDDSLPKILEDISELLFQYVENAKPSPRIYQGKSE